MKKYFIVFISLLLILSNCTDENSGGNSDNSKKTRLIINNQSDVNIVNVNYASVDFGSISKGETSTKEVAQGTRYIYFSININDDSIDCRTDVVTCEEGQDTNFNMTNNTTIVETAGDTRTTIRNLYNTLLSIPANLRISAATENSISFLWNEVNGASGYNIYRAASQNGTYLKLNLNVLTAAEYIDSTTAANVVYWYAVSTVINAIETTKSEAIPAVTLISAPANLQMSTSTLSSINLTWNIVNGVGGYNVYRASSENGNYIKLNTELITSGTYTDTGLTSNTVYFYKVCAVVSIMEGILSNPVSASTLIPAPVELRASAITNDSISIAWDSLSNVIGYNVFRSSSEYGTYTKVNSNLIPNTEYTDSSISSNTTYYYKVNAVTSSIESMQSFSIPVSTSIVVSGNDLTAKLDWLNNNVESNMRYVIELTSDEYITASTLSYSGRSGITVTLVGIGEPFNINTTNVGGVFTVNTGVTLIINNIILRGNGNSVVYINGGTMIMNGGTKITGGDAYSSNVGSGYVGMGGGGVLVVNGQLVMNGGEVSDNKASRSNAFNGGGIYVLYGTFLLNNGKICGNTCTRYDSYGGGVNVSPSGTFIMKGGEIFGNSATYGGGISIGGGSANIRIGGGVIYGSNAPTGYKNTGIDGYSALYQTLRYGTFLGDTFYPTGNLSGSDNTIRIVDGVLLTE